MPSDRDQRRLEAPMMAGHMRSGSGAFLGEEFNFAKDMARRTGSCPLGVPRH